jgi:hypothetical protein
MLMVMKETGNFSKKHVERLLHHVNVEAIQLFQNWCEGVKQKEGKKKKASSIYDSTYA